MIAQQNKTKIKALLSRYYRVLSLLTSVVITTLVFGLSFYSIANGHTDDVDGELIAAMINAKKPGGEATVNSQGANAFSFNSANMSSRRKGDFLIGNDFFEDPWVIAPSSTTVRDGLGPLFNVSSCQTCHANDGSGHAPINKNDDVDTLLVRLSTKMNQIEQGEFINAHPDKANRADAQYGDQIQNRAIPSTPPEMQIAVDYEEKVVTFDDGESVTLRKPIFHFRDLNYGSLNQNMVFSPRVANQMIGLGLLEAIDEKEIIALAKQQQRNADKTGSPIKGIANNVWNIKEKKLSLGRFGWKAGQPTVEQQVAAAFNGDLGLTNQFFTKDHCLKHQTDCLNAPNGNDESPYEIRDDLLEFVSFYSRNLAVPERRNTDSEAVKQGARIFVEADCNACHQPNWTTKSLDVDRIELSNQNIWPYTDMLLHDMGEALSDFDYQNNPIENGVKNEFQATVRHWRTPPLWGIGLRQVVNKDATFLHDGRARNILEAVLWHGGEAEQSKQKVLSLNAEERQALIQFLESI